MVEEVHDPTDAAPAAAPQEPPPSVPGSVAVTRGDAMWTFQFRAAAGAGAAHLSPLSADGFLANQSQLVVNSSRL